MNDKGIRLMGLARRAGKCALGAFAVETAIKRKKCGLVMIAEDSGENTKSKFINLCDRFNVKYIFFSSKNELGEAVGLKEKSVVGITDEGFSKGLLECI